jgi:hypothetical protein
MGLATNQARSEWGNESYDLTYFNCNSFDPKLAMIPSGNPVLRK